MNSEKLKKYYTSFINLFKTSDNFKIEEKINLNNLRILRNSTPLLVVIELLFFLFSSTLINESSDTFFRPVYALISAIGSVAVFFVSSYLLANQRKTNQLNNSLTSTLVLLFYLFISFISIYSDIGRYRLEEQMMFFFVVQFCFLFFIIERPLLVLVVVTISFFWFTFSVIQIDGGKNLNFIILFIFYFFTVIGNAIKYKNYIIQHIDEQQLKMQAEEHKIIVLQSGKYPSRYDIKKDIVYNVEEACKSLGIPEAIEAPAKNIPNMDFVLPESRLAVKNFYSNMRKEIPNGTEHFHIRSVDGTVIWQRGDYTLQKDEFGQYVRAIISFSNVTEQMEQEIAHKQRINEIINLAKDCYLYAECYLDTWEIKEVDILSDKVVGIAQNGMGIDDLVNKRCKPIVHADDFDRFREFFNKNRIQLLSANNINTDKIEIRLILDGKTSWFRFDICLVKVINSPSIHFFIILQDIDKEKTQMSELVEQATHDRMTNLYNRETTLKNIEQYLFDEGKNGHHALLMIDLDNLKEVNDTLGHQTGDEILKKVAASLLDRTSEADICGRIGGDEFFVFLKNTNVNHITKVSKEILTDMHASYKSTQKEIFTSVSIGIATYNGENQKKTLKDLYTEADAALYKSKAIEKNTYTFFDDLDTLSTNSSEDLSQNELISYNLRALLDNIANGIAIFHGSSLINMAPMFCNAKLLDFLKMDQGRFFSHMSKENNYAIHPEDLISLERTLSKSIRKNNTAQGTYRILTSDGSYKYVTIFANAHHLDDGSIDLYCVFSDAQESQEFKQLQETQHHIFQEKWLKATQDNVGYILLNLSKNKCMKASFDFIPTYELDYEQSAKTFLSDLNKNIASEEYAKRFIQSFNIEALKADITKGLTHKELNVPILLKYRGVHWYHISADLSINPNKKEIEAFLALSDVDGKIRLQNVVDKMLSEEYEYICNIDVKTGMLTRIGATNEDHIDDSQNGKINYQAVLEKGTQVLLPKAYWEEGYSALSLNKVINELATKTKYSCVFPVIFEQDKGERLCQWNFEYVDSMKQTILMSRINISKYLDYGYDPLTGLFARNGFYQNVRTLLNNNQDKLYYLLEIDFDNFKLINEDFGYSEGSRILRKFATDLKKGMSLLDPMAIFGHFEADHFLVCLSIQGNFSPESIYDYIKKQVELYESHFNLLPKMGVYKITNPALEVQMMCDCVHIANRASKDDFTKNIVYYTEDIRDKMLDEQLLINQMQQALDQKQFKLWFQPQVNHANKASLIGAEALVRWIHPTKGMISPALFIPIFEQNGFIYELDKYVLNEACSYIRKMLDAKQEPVPISVNLSRIDILQPDIIDFIISTVHKYNIPYDLLHLEITESAFSENTGKVIEVTNELIKRGFTIAIDDFGSGYSSLSLLRNVPAHILKLDMRFFTDDKQTLRNRCIIESIVRMAKMLSMATLAEGVEYTTQADFLQSVGCNYIQGYLYSKPLPYEQFLEYITKSNHELPIMQHNQDASTENNESELFRSLISDTNNIIFVAEMDSHQMLYANHAAEQYFGMNFDPMVSMTCSEFCHQHSLCLQCPTLNLKKGERLESSFKSDDRYMQSLYTRMDWNGHDAFVIFQTDITAQMQELEMVDSIIRNTPGATLLFEMQKNGQLVITYASKQAREIFLVTGITDEHPTLEAVSHTIYHEDFQRITQAMKNAIENKTSFHEEFRILFKDGTTTWIEFAANPVIDANKNYKFYGVYSNIDARKTAQLKIDNIIQNIPSALTIYEVGQNEINRIYISDSAKKLLGSKDSTHSKTALDDIYAQICPEDEQRIRDITGTCIKLQKPFCVQFKLKYHDKHVKLESKPISDKDGLFYYSIFTDITAQKQFEMHLEDKNIILNTQEAVNLGLQEALRKETTEETINYIIGFAGTALQGDRAYIVQKNPDGTDSNTYEWCEEGIQPSIDTLQNLPAEICQPWYDQFEKKGIVVIKDVEKLKNEEPLLYKALEPQNIQSLIVAPFFNENKEAIGFFGIDNPPQNLMEINSALVKTIAYFIEATLMRAK